MAYSGIKAAVRKPQMNRHYMRIAFTETDVRIKKKKKKKNHRWVPSSTKSPTFQNGPTSQKVQRA